MGHLKQVNESYFEHLATTARVASRLVCAAGCQLIHGLVPDLNPPFNNNLESIIGFLNRNLPCNRINGEVDDEELYTSYGGD
tara:strand:+ start:375 stop:620 length:246 start_codon:yes stop_codon:yes gene_type:complete